MRPNVVIIVVDALRADRVGIIGGGDLTPAIDTFANDSAVFTRAFSTTNATDPAVTSIMTGRYPLSHGIVHHGKRVTDDEKRVVRNITQLPEVLSSEGYRTAKLGRPLGRWHRSGFDRYPEVGEWRQAHDAAAEGVPFRRRIGSMLKSINPRIENVASHAYKLAAGRIGRHPDSTQEVMINRSNVVDDFASFIHRGDPFFSFIHLMDTHTPYAADREIVWDCLNQFNYEDIPLEDLALAFPDGSIARNKFRRPETLISNVDYWKGEEVSIGTALVAAHYDAAVQEADDRICTILDQLREKHIFDETLICILSDHGESIMEQGIFFSHHGLYDSTVHVPLVFRPPGGSPGRHDELVQITDIAPTVTSYLDICGLSDVDGRSLRPVIDEGASLNRPAIIAEEAYTQRRRMTRTHDEKLIHLVRGDTKCRHCGVQHAPPVEYYLLDQDPKEETNCEADHSDQVSRMRDFALKLAEHYLNQRPQLAGDKPISYEDESAIHDHLEALGYR